MSIAPPEVHAELDRLLSSVTFAKSQRMRRLLRFVVEQAVSGDRDRLNEYAIGLEVFDRNAATYSPGDDPIVRVQVGRLREKLQQYYANAQDDATLRFDIPLGSYVPTIRRLKPQDAGHSPNRTLMILSIKGIAVDAAGAQFAQGLREELVHHLFRALGDIVMPRPMPNADATEAVSPGALPALQDAGYLLEGSVRLEGEQARVSTRLIDARTGGLIWSAQFDRQVTGTIATQEELATTICEALKAHLRAEPSGATGPAINGSE